MCDVLPIKNGRANVRDMTDSDASFNSLRAINIALTFSLKKISQTILIILHYYNKKI